MKPLPSWLDSLNQSKAAKKENLRRIGYGPTLKIPIRKDLTMAAWFDDYGTASTYDATGSNYITIDSTGSTTTATITGGTSSTTYVTTGGNWYVQKVPYYAPPPVAPAAPTPDPRVLNRYLNAADLLEEFIKDLGQMGVRQSEVLHIPIELFVNWLICKSAEEDGHEPPEGIEKLPAGYDRTHHDRRCKHCGRFISREAPADFCSGQHFDDFTARRIAQRQRGGRQQESPPGVHRRAA